MYTCAPVYRYIYYVVICTYDTMSPLAQGQCLPLHRENVSLGTGTMCVLAQQECLSRQRDNVTLSTEAKEIVKVVLS